MAEETTEKQQDFAKLWRDWLTQTERQFNAFFSDIMGSEAFSRTMGTNMEAFVASQRMMAQMMERYLAFMNMPSREDVVGLGETLRSIEARLARIEETLQIAAAAVDGEEAPAAPPKEPARTRRPKGVPVQDEATSEPPIPAELRR